MHIEITLGGALIQFRPEGSAGNRFSYKNDDALTLETLLKTLGVPEEQRLMTILNGAVVQPQSYSQTALNDGDELSLMPPIAAG